MDGTLAQDLSRADSACFGNTPCFGAEIRAFLRVRGVSFGLPVGSCSLDAPAAVPVGYRRWLNADAGRAVGPCVALYLVSP